MRCEICKQYVPEGLGIKYCPVCGSEIKENERLVPSDIENNERGKNDPNPLDSLPEYKTTKFNKEQILKIENRLSKEFNSMLILSIIGLLIIIGSFIPVEFLPRSYRIHDFDKSRTLIETMGIMSTVIFWAIFGSIIYLTGFRKNIFFKLRKDLRDAKIYTFETKIVRIDELKGDSGKEYNVFIEKNNANIEKLNYLQSEFPELTNGDFIQVSITQNAHFVVKTKEPLIQNRRRYNS